MKTCSLFGHEFCLAFFDLGHGIALAMRTKGGRATVLRTPLWVGSYIRSFYEWLYGIPAYEESCHAPTRQAPEPEVSLVKEPEATSMPNDEYFYQKYLQMQREQYEKVVASPQ